MNIKKIEYPTKWNDPLNDNIDVFVTLENGKSYCVTVAALGWINKEVTKHGYLPSSVHIIISEFSDDNIKKAISEYAENDAYWLRVYSVSSGDSIPE